VLQRRVSCELSGSKNDVAQGFAQNEGEIQEILKS